MKVFLTGEVQTGKSTLVNKVVQALPAHCRVGGFRTVTIQDIQNAIGSVYIVPATQEPLCYGAHNRVGIRHGLHRPPTAFPEVFNTEGVRILQAGNGCDFLVMDEIGTLENDAHAFSALVKAKVSSGGNMLGVVKPKKSDLLDFIRSQPAVCLLEVTAENRDALFHELMRLFCEE